MTALVQWLKRFYFNIKKLHQDSRWDIAGLVPFLLLCFMDQYILGIIIFSLMFFLGPIYEKYSELIVNGKIDLLKVGSTVKEKSLQNKLPKRRQQRGFRKNQVMYKYKSMEVRKVRN